MTCIATDGRTIAADSRTTFADTIMDDSTPKLERGPDGSILGTAGDAAICQLVREWWKAGGSTRALPDIQKVDVDGDTTFAGLILYHDGRVAYIDPHFTPVPTSIPFAVGSGKKVALGAMLSGRTPAEAIEIASRAIPTVGGGIVEWKVEKPKAKAKPRSR